MITVLSSVTVGLYFVGVSAALQPLFPLRYMEPCAEGAGVCMTGIECGLQRGRSLGTCSFGTCCRLEKTCNEQITANNTFFVSPDEVKPGSSCSVEVVKKWHLAGVCQMRLDFIRFDTIGPNFASGICVQDHFSVTGADHTVPMICGSNDKQHIYVDVRNSRSIQLSMSIGQNVATRNWRIKVTQIPCFSDRLAPPHCLQYFEEDSGIISSFNYGNADKDSAYPLNMRYRMCFRQACTMQLSQLDRFGLGQRSEEVRSVTQIQDVTIDDKCMNPKDPNTNDLKAYLSIDGVRFCGDHFLTQYTTRNAISTIGFTSPAREAGRENIQNAPYSGFRIQFRQNCGKLMQ